MGLKFPNVIFSVLISTLFVNPLFAQQEVQVEVDCDFYEQGNVERSKKQAISDSMDIINFVPAAKVKTEACMVPSNNPVTVSFDVQKNKIYGFYKAVENADKYVTVISKAGMTIGLPVDGIDYKKGDYIDKGWVVSANGATAFGAIDLEPNTTYNIAIYAANDNCDQGTIYNTNPLYTGQKTTGSTSEFNYYFGNLHSHSGYSDGNKENTSVTPSEDYAFAKQSQCMDFLGIAEHNHFSSPANPGMLLANYGLGVQKANTFTSSNPGFLALYGMEFGVISNGGHVVVYGIDSLLGWETLSGSPNYNIYIGKYDYSGSNGLFSTITRFKPGKHAFGYLAHPDDNDYGNLLNTAYRPIADSALIGSAVESGPAFSEATNYSDYPSRMSYLQYYKGLLAKGYHIGPIIDHDNHYVTFGRTARSRLVVLGASLSKDDFMSAMSARRFYTSHSCTAMLDFKVSGADMGREIEHADAPAIVVSIEDASSTQQPSIKIYKGTNDGNSAVIVSTESGHTSSYTDNTLADGASAYYFADITIGNSRTISSPVWYHRNDNPSTAIQPTVFPKKQCQIAVLENPVQGQVLRYKLPAGFTGSVGMVQITDLSGRVLYHHSVKIDDSIKNVSVSSIPVGSYILKIVSENGESYARFVKY